nr:MULTISPECIES: hypothetical protein [unclassified Mesorhizobium]
MSDPKLTDAGYDYNDFFPSLRAALTWKMEAGQIATGEGGQIWAIPHAFENIQLFYRKDTLEKYNIAVPTSPPEMAGRTPMAIDSNMFGFWNDVAGKPASGEDRLRSAAARTERHELRF